MPVRLSEDNFIELMARLSRGEGPRPVAGIGDDAAVLEPPRKGHTLVTTDLLTEGVHFLRARTPPRLLGRKAMAVNLSDIAAMGGVPLQALVSVRIRPGARHQERPSSSGRISDSARATSSMKSISIHGRPVTSSTPNAPSRSARTRSRIATS